MPAVRRSRSTGAHPDPIDFRDLPFRANIAVMPRNHLFPDIALPVKYQGDTSACTGFALSLVVEYLLRKSRREPRARVSPYMLYSMACRYDEFAGGVKQDTGSSLRGALKGWQKHGACNDALWTTGLAMPPAQRVAKKDWWLDAVTRPLGAYYRIDTTQIADMHAALNELGILYASAACHAGWDEGSEVKPLRARPTSFARGIWQIPAQRAKSSDGGHAFAIVGYTRDGFLLQNSWDTDWGSYGYAILTYDDWAMNAMDCWVAQLGVETTEHAAIAESVTLRLGAARRVEVSANTVLRNREISPFVIDMGNNGQLSNGGKFRTTPGDIHALVDVHMREARARWQLGDAPMDVCVYAHGGLVSEDSAAQSASTWIAALYDAHIFPVFLMWETDLLHTIADRLEDAVKGIPRAAGAGFWSRAESWWNQRLERLFAAPGSLIWGEMKQNADAISGSPSAGAVLLYETLQNAGADLPLRFHLVGHSAGSIVHSWLIDRAVRQGMTIDSVSFMAPAVTNALFVERALPHLRSGAVKRYQQFHLTDQAEEDDSSCGPYTRSLLYLVSESFEHAAHVPILGMQKYARAALASVPSAVVYEAPCAACGAKEHGQFDNDAATRAAIIDFIHGGAADAVTRPAPRRAARRATR